MDPTFRLTFRLCLALAFLTHLNYLGSQLEVPAPGEWLDRARPVEGRRHLSPGAGGCEGAAGQTDGGSDLAAACR
jgi:hypothetical protein